MRRYRARAEFRRASRTSPWVLAGVWIDDLTFHPAAPGVDPTVGRLPDAGLLGWVELAPIIAPDAEAAGEAGLTLAKAGWPESGRSEVPFATRYRPNKPRIRPW